MYRVRAEHFEENEFVFNLLSPLTESHRCEFKIFTNFERIILCVPAEITLKSRN